MGKPAARVPRMDEGRNVEEGKPVLHECIEGSNHESQYV
jgi:hypothetical protein